MGRRLPVVMLLVVLIVGVTAGAVAASAINGTYRGYPIARLVVNGQHIETDVPAFVMEGRTMVPVRFVSEALGAQVSWDPETYTVSITTGPGDPDTESSPENPAKAPSPATFHQRGGLSPEFLEMQRQIFEKDIYPLVTEGTGLVPAGEVPITFTKDENAYLSLMLEWWEDPADARKAAEVTGGVASSLHGIAVAPTDSTDRRKEILAHELFHVLLFQNGAQVPNWINEGLAVYWGLKARYGNLDSLEAQSQIRYMEELVYEQFSQGNGIDLALTSEQNFEVIDQYPIEDQAYIAVQFLVDRFGIDKLNLFLRETSTQNPAEAFERVFGIDGNIFARWFRDHLERLASRETEWIGVTFEVPNDAAGFFTVFAPGRIRSDGYLADGGTASFRLYPNGGVYTQLPIKEGWYYTVEEAPTDYAWVYYRTDEPFEYEGRAIKEVSFSVRSGLGKAYWAGTVLFPEEGDPLWYEGTMLPNGVRLVEVQSKLK